MWREWITQDYLGQHAIIDLKEERIWEDPQKDSLINSKPQDRPWWPNLWFEMMMMMMMMMMMIRTQTNLYTAGLPKKEDITNFWADIWGKPVNYNTKATWLEHEKARATNIPDMTDSEIIKSDIEKAIKKTNKWKAPGPDQLQNFWYKKFTAVHGTMAILMNDLSNPQKLPKYFMMGKMFLILKDPDTTDPAKYHPIMCLSTIYKLLTSILADKIYKHMHGNDIMTEKQKGCYKSSRGCKDQIIIDEVLTKQAIKKKGTLSMAYIDYKKAFNSVLHNS
jgi:hypothetical protein